MKLHDKPRDWTKYDPEIALELAECAHQEFCYSADKVDGEGWAVFECGDGQMVIQCDDEQDHEQYDSDADAEWFVLQRALLEGSYPHLLACALCFLSDHIRHRQEPCDPPVQPLIDPNIDRRHESHEQREARCRSKHDNRFGYDYCLDCGTWLNTNRRKD